MKTYQIYLLRHGVTQGNLEGKYIGSTDAPLCEYGEKTLHELVEQYDYPGAGAFFTSPMLRCQQSMRILYPDAKPIVINELRECDFGLFEQMSADELKDSKQFSEWISADADYAPPGGESGEHFSSRICEAFEAIVNGLLKTGIRSCVIMTHGGVIGALLSRYGLPRAQAVDWHCDPGYGYAVRIQPQLWMTGRVVEVYDRIPYEKTEEEIED